MKAALFDYERPDGLDGALALLSRDDLSVRPVAGSQSLGPMLNLRLVQPDLLVDVSRLPELTGIRRDGDHLVIGASVTHARLEDGDYPDVTGGALARVAAGIAYRPVRNRGTIGGSLAHADPAADWVSALTAMGASVVLAGPAGRRTVPMDGFILGVFETALQPGEVIAEVRVPAFSPAARWGYYKVCRKTGEFSHATGAVLLDPPRGVARAVIGAVSGPPLVIDDPAVFTDPARRDAVAADRLATSSIAGDPAAIRTHMVALARAIAQVNP
ncbi:carbon monoxide dehydrogenase [Azospirillum sp. RWY-5-1]|uniref:Carbon monoxide dehydrogenase n=1 Tax=Azospirillum oleiclasticum TaxID=2735135 RepID=A0ABX2T6H5_9PROT|nr:FAD binding domain-containing protein [Azospirillum oleiclasticum]NYZ12634.1 carbon monoxide dehydrogenase [Azospirillum oleiclasticum]NYZ19794.1 carbon monoxide dehydrogenase [Azospirillum oleiclasticum]